MRLVVLLVFALSMIASAACQGVDNDISNSDSDADSDMDSDADADADGGEDTSPDGQGTLRGTVLAPNGSLPISGALVYLTDGDAEPIEDGAHCYGCDDMTGKKWTLSGPTGEWELADAPAGVHNIITSKGLFRRQRSVEVAADEVIDVPVETTTLPSSRSDDGLDVIPNYAVLLNEWDQQHNLLAKLGLGSFDTSGNFEFGSESFTIYNDDLSQSGYPWSSQLFTSQETLEQYHMLFFPCTSATNGVSFVTSHAAMIQEYVANGGKMYSSCCTALWNVAAFPGYIDYYDDDSPDQFDIGRISSSAYSTTGEVLDSDMAVWLELVSGQPSTEFPFTNGYVKIDGLNEVNDGHGLDTDGGIVKPRAWVSDNSAYPGSPLIVTYNWDCGKVFYSVYETSHEVGETIQPQEYVLLYVILEVGVCDGQYEPPE